MRAIRSSRLLAMSLGLLLPISCVSPAASETPGDTIKQDEAERESIDDLDREIQELLEKLDSYDRRRGKKGKGKRTSRVSIGLGALTLVGGRAERMREDGRTDGVDHGAGSVFPFFELGVSKDFSIADGQSAGPVGRFQVQFADAKGQGYWWITTLSVGGQYRIRLLPRFEAYLIADAGLMDWFGQRTRIWTAFGTIASNKPRSHHGYTTSAGVGTRLARGEGGWGFDGRLTYRYFSDQRGFDAHWIGVTLSGSLRF